MDHQMDFRVLGPLEILADGRPVEVDAPKQRAILAMLLIHANEVVSTDQLLEAVWEEEQPSGGPRTLRYHVSKLREALPVDVITTRSPGYALEVSPSRIDALVFESLLAEARDIRVTDRVGALKLLDEALGLWRGDPYASFTYDEFAHTEILSLHELRLRAMEDRFEICIELGREDEVIGDLQRLVEEHPRRERLVGALMLALYRSGRQSESLSAYQDLRRELGEGLGIEPSPELQDLEEKILLQDASLTEATATPAGDFLRGYVLRGRIGEGAHGVVWRAGQPGVGREVAIKAIHPDISNRPGFIRRFEMEAQLVASLEHPHIVSLFDFWRDPEGAYLVMPYLRGGDLDHLLRQGPLRPDTALELIRAIGGALAYAHRRGVIHRDVTPHNVLLDDEGHPYLADFGVATLIGETGPPISSSPGYLSPEQSAGQGASPQSDVFSLGVLTHAVLSGQAPTVGEQLRPVSSYRSDLASGVDEIIEVATALDIDERYAGPEALVADLSRSLGAPTPAPAMPVIETRNPYKGLRAFAESDAGDFFGRELLESELVEAVSRHRLVGVIGPSGCGKSSLVRAGLIPLLRRGVLPGSDKWLITDMYPGSQPFSELQAALLRVAIDVPKRFGERLAGEDDGRKALLGELLPPDTELLLIIDQFEELFTLTGDEDSRSRFLEALAEFAGDPLNRVRIVVTLRADFYDRPLQYAEFAELLRKGLVTVAVPGRDGLLKAVTGPAQRVGLEVEPGLAERITNDVAGQPGGLPLLEYALTELFQRRTDSRLTLAGYEQTGGVLGALGRRAEDLYSGRDEAGQQAVQQVFLRLVTVEEGSADTRRRIALTELRGMGLDPDVLQQVLDDYGSHRLLTFDRDPDTRAPTVEVAHEALLTRWDRLRTWIDDRRDDLVLHRRLAASLAEWRDSDERPEYLLSGGRLDHFEAFATDSDIALTAEEREFLAQSRAHADQLAGRRRRRRRAIMTGFGIAALIATVFAVVAFLNQQRAEDEAARAEANELAAVEQKEAADQSRAAAEQERLRAEAETARARASELATLAAQELDEDPEVSVLLLLESMETAEPTQETVSALHEAVLADRLVMWLPEPYADGVLAPTGDRVIAFGEESIALIAVPSGEVIWQEEQNERAWIGAGRFTSSGDRVFAIPESLDEEFRSVPDDLSGIHVIDVSTGERTVHQIESIYPVDSLIPNSSGWINADLPLVATGNKQATPSDPTDLAVLRIDLESASAEPIALYDTSALSLAQWGTDHAVSMLAFGISQQTAVLDLDTGKDTGFGPTADYRSNSVPSPDGRLVVTTGDIRNDVWDIVDGVPRWAIPDSGRDDEDDEVVFSSDGTTVLIGNRLWDVDSGSLMIEFPGGGPSSLSADGSLVMFGEAVFNAGPHGEVGGIDLPSGGRYSRGIDRTGATGVALQYLDGGFGTAHVYDIESGEVKHEIENVAGLPAISADGTVVALQLEVAPNWHGSIGIFDTQTGELTITLPGLCASDNDVGPGPDCRRYPETPFSGFAHYMSFSPDGKYLVAGLETSGSPGGGVALAIWDLGEAELVYTSAASLVVWDPVFDPSGSVLAVPQAERVLLLEPGTWQPVGEIPETGFNLRFFPDGSLLASGYEGLVRYETGTGRHLVQNDYVCDFLDMDISPDGSLVATPCMDGGEIAIYDGETLELVQVIPTGDSWIRGVSFLNESHLLAIRFSGPGIILTTDTEELIQIARDQMTIELTAEDCEDLGIHNTCPADSDN